MTKFFSSFFGLSSAIVKDGELEAHHTYQGLVSWKLTNLDIVVSV